MTITVGVLELAPEELVKDMEVTLLRVLMGHPRLLKKICVLGQL